MALEYYFTKEDASNYANKIARELDSECAFDVFSDIGDGYDDFIDTLSQEELRKVFKKELMAHYDEERWELVSTEALKNLHSEQPEARKY